MYFGLIQFRFKNHETESFGKDNDNKRSVTFSVALKTERQQEYLWFPAPLQDYYFSRSVATEQCLK